MNNFQDMSFINGAKRNRWKILNLSEVINDESRKVVKIPKREYLENGHYPIIDQGKSFIGGYTDLENGIYNEVPFLVFGDHTRVVKYVENPSFIGADGVKVLKNKLGEEELNTRYLYYFLNNVKLPNTGYNRHFKFLKQVVIPIPPIETQKKIVDVLDKAQEIINKRKQQITALSTLTQSVFVNMFIENDIGNGKVPLKELCEFNPKKSELKEEDPNLGVSFIPMESVSENGDMELNEIRTLEEVYKKYTYFREGMFYSQKLLLAWKMVKVQ
ncbi:restriction endonuclease subunit S [Virgibacillus sp. 179-BFC.A HS]|uniref:Restriction endonuclease subunit S n=1 Tax=Tigheibacillus jepli TaxID=3035914 RepID=A0ABU5CFS5_9BACI|nr:restriction endonuclease subunit S [Virgibacillus sp. 179-BFC.A HS]MDY0405172.1 restriction endonuclease subunit S [Virgibacillus sp. 179-BFC.A HS]